VTFNHEQQVRNDGWVRVKDETSEDEIVKMRGYRIDRKQTERIEVASETCKCAVL